MAANEKQVAGSHYGGTTVAYQHWDIVVEHKLNYFQGQITKYVMRASKKNGKQDLEKARHFLDKYLEVYDQLHPTEKLKEGAGYAVQIKTDPAYTAPWTGTAIPTPRSQPEPTRGDHVQTQFVDERFTIEGHAASGQALYKCKACGQEQWAKTNWEAHMTHGSCAGRGYIAQG
jgi:hypothetical protein